MLTLNQPPLTQHVSVPKDMSQLSVEAYTAGLVEGVLDGLNLVCCSLLTLSWHLFPTTPKDRADLVVARASDSTYCRYRSVSSTHSHLDQARSERHGS